MPPVYKHVNVLTHFDGSTYLDFFNGDNYTYKLPLIYIPNAVDSITSDKIFKLMTSNNSPLCQHEYHGNFNRTIKPSRMTYADVPDRPFYRYKGHDLNRTINPVISEMKSILASKYDHDSYIINGYRYNGKDYISPHVDDEKFLQSGNYIEFGDKMSTVFTYTFLRNPQMKMTYCFGDPETGNGYSVEAKHGSLIMQGSVLHDVVPYKHKINLMRDDDDIYTLG